MGDTANTAAGVISSLKGWASRPFDSTMNLGQWALFTGLVIVLVIMWLMILKEIRGEL